MLRERREDGKDERRKGLFGRRVKDRRKKKLWISADEPERREEIRRSENARRKRTNRRNK